LNEPSRDRQATDGGKDTESISQPATDIQAHIDQLKNLVRLLQPKQNSEDIRYFYTELEKALQDLSSQWTPKVPVQLDVILDAEDEYNRARRQETLAETYLGIVKSAVLSTEARNVRAMLGDINDSDGVSSVAKAVTIAQERDAGNATRLVFNHMLQQNLIHNLQSLVTLPELTIRLDSLARAEVKPHLQKTASITPPGTVGDLLKALRRAWRVEKMGIHSTADLIWFADTMGAVALKYEQFQAERVEEYKDFGVQLMEADDKAAALNYSNPKSAIMHWLVAQCPEPVKSKDEAIHKYRKRGNKINTITKYLGKGAYLLLPRVKSGLQ